MSEYLKAHLSLARASNLPTTWSNVLCACLVADGFNGPPVLGAILAVSLFYMGGMYLNDWWDSDHDQRHQAYRPIPSKRISRMSVLIFAIVYFLAALGISLALNPLSGLWALGLLACIVLYDLDHKNNKMSPWLMAGCRGLIYPWAVVVSGQVFTVELWLASAAAFVYTLGLTYIARGFLPCLFKLLLSAVVLLPAFIWMSHMGGELVAPGLFALIGFLFWMVHCLGGLFCRSPKIGFTVGNLIAGFCFLDLLAVSMVSPYALLALPLFALLFYGTIRFQKLISGT